MLVDAYNTCIDQLQGTVDGCSVFEASRDQDKAYHCQSTGQVVAEVSQTRLCCIVGRVTAQSLMLHSQGGGHL